MSALPFNIALDDSGPCNGDYLVTDAHGRLVALIYRGFGKHGDAVAKSRAERFVAAVNAAWCSTCGEDTPNTAECETCASWWAANAPREVAA